MSRALVAIIVAALIGGACGADRTAGAAPTPSERAAPAATTQPQPSPTTAPVDAAGPTPTPTTRVIAIPVTPSEAALLCSQAGLVAAALDGCLQYEAADCGLDDLGDECERARDVLEAVLGTRIFPSDCAQLVPDETDPPAWCELE